MKKSLFLCSTPFHILVASAITLSEGLDSDLYVLDCFLNCKEICDGVKDAGVFKKVLLISDYYKYESIQDWTIIHKYFKVLSDYLSTERIIKGYVSDQLYDSFYVYHREQCFVRMLSMYLKKHNPLIKLYYYDDGIGSYCDGEMYQDHTITQLFEKLYCGSSISKKDFIIKLFLPELYPIGFNNNIPIPQYEGICKVNKIDKFDKVLSSLFCNVHGSNIDKKIIFLDTIRTEEFTLNGIEKFNHIVEKLVEEFPNDLIIKKHPRDLERVNEKKGFSSDGIPLEYYCNYNDLNEYTIITSFSTAAFTPKLLYDQEPRIIFLYNILEDCLIQDIDRDSIVRHIKEIYVNKEKVSCPKTMDELLTCINL